MGPVADYPVLVAKLRKLTFGQRPQLSHMRSARAIPQAVIITSPFDHENEERTSCPAKSSRPWRNGFCATVERRPSPRSGKGAAIPPARSSR